jgi:hypothetical protein
MSAKFNGIPGDYGSMTVINLSNSSGGNNPLGFSQMITEIKSGGSYSWAVIGFNTKTLAEFKTLNFDPALYLSASSASNNFTVSGVWKELTVSVASGTTVYTYSDNSGGYNVGSSGSVTLTVTTPNSTATTGSVYVNGYTSTSYPLTFGVVNGVNTATVTIALSNNSNWVNVDDGTGTMFTNFGIYTSGGTLAKIGITTVSASTCASPSGAASLVGPDSWSNYTSPDACTVTVSGTLNTSITAAAGTLYVNVWNNNDNGYYNTQIAYSAGATAYTVTVPVYNGQNWVSVSNYDMATGVSNWNGFSVDTQAGTTYVAPISATVATTVGTLTPTSQDVYQTYYDAGAATSVTLNVSMPNNTTGTYYLYSDPGYTFQGSGSITGTTLSTTLTLFNGWNYINLYDSANNYYAVNIYTTGGTVYTPPNLVTGITDGVTPLSPTASYGYYQYPATGTTSACSVDITGTTTSVGNVNVYHSYYNNTTGASVYETQSVATTGTGPYSYTITQTVYGGGTNYIDISDASWNWQGVQVTTSCATAPVVFGVSSVTDGTNTLTADVYGTYNTTTASVTVNGTAKPGAITAYVSGQYYATYTTTASAGTYSINLPVYAGYDYISLTDGSNWTYVNVYTTSAATVYTPPINSVTVSGSTLSSGGGASDTWSSWNTSLDTVNISGTAQVAGTGSWSQSGASYNSGTFTVSAGTFTLTGVTLGYGYNYFTLYDANWNSYYLDIYTSGGIGAPAKVVAITGPLQNATASGATTVSGTINTASFAPVYVYGYVYDYTTGVSTYYSNQAADQSAGYQALNYSAGAFSFNTSVISPNPTFIEVYASDLNGMQHGHYVYVNNTYGYSDYFWKPGTKATAKSAKAMAHQTEFVKKMMRR